MLMKKLMAGGALTTLALVLSAAAVQAQETTGGISGEITDDAGKPIAGAQVTVTYVPTGQVIHTSTTGQGYFTARNLTVGGPYTVVATDKTHEAKTVQVPSITLGSPYEMNFTLGGGGVTEVVVTASRGPKGTAQVQTGPRSTFTAQDIENLPSFGGDLKDVARTNPLVTIDPSNSNALIIAGANNHVNTIYVDGVRQSDDFGLNANGYPTQRSPISVDAVAAFNVEVAPYDVRYGNFQGGILNIVTKSGSNSFHGGGFYEYDSNKYAGDVIGRQALMQQSCPNGAATGTFSVTPAGYTSPFTVNCGDRQLSRTSKTRPGAAPSAARSSRTSCSSSSATRRTRAPRPPLTARSTPPRPTPLRA